MGQTIVKTRKWRKEWQKFFVIHFSAIATMNNQISLSPIVCLPTTSETLRVVLMSSFRDCNSRQRAIWLESNWNLHWLNQIDANCVFSLFRARKCLGNHLERVKCERKLSWKLWFDEITASDFMRRADMSTSGSTSAWINFRRTFFFETTKTFNELLVSHNESYFDFTPLISLLI